MRIVYLITRADAVGGASIHVRDLARTLRDLGHETMVLVGGHGPVTDQLEAAGVSFESLRWLRRELNPLRDTLAFFEVVQTLRRLNPELLSAHTAKAGSVGRMAGTLLGIPTLYTPHGWPAGERMPSVARRLFGLIERGMARLCDGIVCVCEHERGFAIEKRIAEPEKLVVVHNGVQDVKAELRAMPDRMPVRICSVARFDSPKDHPTLLKALALLKHHAWQLDLVGDGPRECAIRDLVRELDLTGRVKFHGYLPDPADLLAQAQIFVLASRSEAFPRSILEAMRAGLPVVASDVGGVREAVTDGLNGRLVEPGCPQALASALCELLESANSRLSMGAAARSAYEQRFRLGTMAGLTLQVYTAVQDRTARSERPA